jgi:hypothetical protein
MSERAIAQMSEQGARQEAVDLVRSKVGLRSEQFLDVKRDESLEGSFVVSAGRGIRPLFIFKLNNAGYEVMDDKIVQHSSTDADLSYIVAISSVDGSAYRIAGFRDSKAELNKLLAALRIKVSSEDQAEELADLYRTVNPEHNSMTRMSGLLDLKQAAERQCQAVPFDPSERDFEAWWKHAKTANSNVSFQQTATRSDSGYAVEWIVLSSPGAGQCGGAPLRARLEVRSNGSIGEISFRPV